MLGEVPPHTRRGPLSPPISARRHLVLQELIVPVGQGVQLKKIAWRPTHIGFGSVVKVSILELLSVTGRIGLNKTSLTRISFSS